MFSEYFRNIVKIMSEHWYTFLVKGVGNTLLLTAITVSCGAVLGVFICLGRMSRVRVFNALALGFGELIRGTPMLLQLYIAYFFLPKLLPFSVSEFARIALAYTVNSACYVSEVFRSGIQAVDAGQSEAARSLGLTSRQTFMHVVLPQAIKNILPALGNEFVMITKDTSLASTFFIGEVMTASLIVGGKTYLTMECLIIVAIIYFCLTWVLNRFVGKMERRLRTSD